MKGRRVTTKLDEAAAPPDEALLAACGGGDAAGMRAALNRGASPRAKTRSDWRELMLAARSGSLAAVAMLLQIDPTMAREANGRGWTALRVACAPNKGGAEAAAALLGFSDVDAVDAEGCASLMEAAENGLLDCVKLLLPHSNLDRRDVHRHSALNLAERLGRREVVEAIRQEMALRSARTEAREIGSDLSDPARGAAKRKSL